MSDKAELYFDGMTQVVRLPEGYQLSGSEVYVRKDTMTGDIVLSNDPLSWDGFFAEDALKIVPEDFMSAADRRLGAYERDTFLGS